MGRWFPSLVVVLFTTVATAEPARVPTTAIANGHRAYVLTPPSGYKPSASVVSPYLFLNRCVGGCTIAGGGTNDASANESTIPCAGGASCSGGACGCANTSSGTYMITEFANSYGQLGANGTCPGTMTTCTTATQDTDCGAGIICDTADLEWSELLACVQQVYSPYEITVADTLPTGGLSYSENIVAGLPSEIGFGGQPILGISPYPQVGDCSAHDNIMSFSFANAHGPTDRINNLCWTVSQESAHAFGLDHEYSFADMSSACNDPMTYRTDCGGEKFFRNQPANCGEYAARTCKCGGLQNSHEMLISVFGPSTAAPLIPIPTASVSMPVAGPVNVGFPVFALAGSKRGIGHVDLSLNGYTWATAAGAAFGTEGQPNPSQYTLTAPESVPNGVIDIVVKAFDDLGTEGDAATVTVTMGSPCTDASTCAKGQLCGTGADAGKCYWNPPTGVLGDACTFPQFCTSGICQGTATDQICTQSCIPGAVGSCPTGYDCIATSGTDGICFPPDNSSGCCSVNHETGAIWIDGGLAALVLGFVRRRRRTKED